MNLPLTTRTRFLWSNFFAIILVALCGYFTIFRGYSNPPALFWDENYHIATAQRYLNGVFFMEPHPPLGKLLIALGEYLIDANPNDAQFIGMEKVREVPFGFSFLGYRLFPVLFAWLAGIVFFLILLLLTRSPFISACLAMLYMLDNALLVHFRSAMLEGIQIFFLLCALLFYFLIWMDHIRHRAAYAIFGIFCALALMVKLNSAVLLVPAVMLVFKLRHQRISFLVCSGWPLVIITFAVWQIHFSLSRNLSPTLSHGGCFEAAPQYCASIKAGEAGALSQFNEALRNALSFAAHYQKGVPQLNYCKLEENGSSPLLWPLGAQNINYRWENTGDGSTRYLYLTPNPVVWLLGLLGLVLSASRVIASFAGGVPLPRSAGATLGLLGMYAFYMCSVLTYSRVFYLYHYFIPIILTHFLLALSIDQMERPAGAPIAAGIRKTIAAVLALSIGVGYFFIYPLTYYEPLAPQEVARRNLLSIWNVRCATCGSVNPLARPLAVSKARRTDKQWRLAIGEVQANYIEQEWGAPAQDTTVQSQPIQIRGVPYTTGFGVHAFSRIQFALEGRYKKFKAVAALPDSVAGSAASVEFKIVTDGKTRWKSGPITPASEPLHIEIDLENVEVLILIMSDAGDGNRDDQGVWANLELVS